MIRSFADRDTERVWRREAAKRFDTRIHKAANRKLHLLDAAPSLDTLRVPPGNRLEALKGIAPDNTVSGSMISGGSAFGGPTLARKTSRSSITTEEGIMSEKLYAPIHPGEVLMEDFIQGFAITQNKLAVSIGVPPRRINEIVHGKRAITADTALRLGRYFGMSPQFWLNLQTQYELELAEDRVAEQIAAITPLQVA